MKQSSFSRLSTLSGVLAAIMVVIVVAVAGYFEPGYSHRVDLISELNAAGAQHATLIGYVGFIPIGLATLFFLWRLKAELAPSRKMVIALILVATIGGDWLVTALAPCDAGCPVSGNISLSQQIHLLWGFIATILMPIGIYLLIGSLRQAKFSQVAIVLSFVVIIVNVMIFILMASSMFNDVLGLLQRINTGIFYVYLALLSMESYRRAVGNPV